MFDDSGIEVQPAEAQEIRDVFEAIFRSEGYEPTREDLGEVAQFCVEIAQDCMGIAEVCLKMARVCAEMALEAPHQDGPAL